MNFAKQYFYSSYSFFSSCFFNENFISINADLCVLLIFTFVSINNDSILNNIKNVYDVINLKKYKIIIKK